jgi:hypothetical protein
MYANGSLILLITFLNMFIVSSLLHSSSPGAQIVGALMKNSSALILWLVGPLAGFIVMVSPKVNGHVGMVQMGYVNVLCSIAFLIVIVYHGYSATNDVYILSRIDRSHHDVSEQLVRLPLICKVANTAEVESVLGKLSNIALWATISVSIYLSGLR